MSTLTSAWAIAATIYLEARGEPFAGKVAVASVMWNEHAAGAGKRTWEQVVVNPRRYSCWRADHADKRRVALMSVALNKADAEAWRDCMSIAQVMVAGTFRPTGKWTHYRAGRRKGGTQIGGHVFWTETAKKRRAA